MEDLKKRLQAEITTLENELRVQLPKEILKARAHGDLSENAEYTYAKEAQGLNEKRIAELEDKLARAQVIETKDLTTDRIVFGCTVLLGDVESDRQVRYKIVGADEADIRNGRISINSPVAKALIGHKMGDVVNVVVPSGKKEYEVLKISCE